jgi:hypothetical protein
MQVKAKKARGGRISGKLLCGKEVKTSDVAR